MDTLFKDNLGKKERNILNDIMMMMIVLAGGKIKNLLLLHETGDVIMITLNKETGTR